MSTNIKPDEKLLEKIRALFRLADATRGASQAEAELAMEKAQMLMTKHGIDQVTVNQQGAEAREARSFNIHEREFNTCRQRYETDQYIARILRECFNVRVVWSASYESVKGFRKTWDGKKVERERLKQRLVYCLIGEPEDTAIAQMVIEELHPMMRHLLNAYLKDQGLPWNAVVCHSFFDGIKDGFIAASNRGKDAVVKTVARDKANQYAIVLVDKEKAINAFVKHQRDMGFITSGRSGGGPRSGGHSEHAYGKGKEAGGKISVGRVKLPSGSNRIGGGE